ncbi:MAG: OmpA/MotB family protein [Planctomycetota bacterium]|jgi:chemotaxis protein MotB
MNKSAFLLLLLGLAAPSCQNPMQEQTIADQEQQLASYQRASSNLQNDLNRIRAENAALQEQIRFEQERAIELEGRATAAEASLQEKAAEVASLQGRLPSGIGVESRGDVIVLSLPSALTFASGKADLNKQGKDSLAAVADVLKSDYSGKTFWVEGHTDSDQPKKSGWKNNLELSVNRALSVSSYLIFDLGIPGEQVRLAGHGEWNPKADNATAEGKATNRRVEILILP